MQIDTFTLEGSLQPFDHAVVDPAPFAIYYRQGFAQQCPERHADLDLRLRQRVDPIAAGKL